MSYKFETAQRTNSKVLIGIYAPSGCGKTYSALLLGRGLAGEQGTLAMIDTENGRGSLYADEIPGGYCISQLTDPFSPQKYVEAIDAAEKAGTDVLIIDSASHEWEGVGGVLDWARQNEERTGKPGLHCWKDPKAAHNRFVLKLLSTRMHVIVCIRAKNKSRQVKNPKTGKNEIVKDDEVTPLQSEDFIFEMTAHLEIKPDHTARVTKAAPNSLRQCFKEGEKISIETGRRIAEWCKGGETKTQEMPQDRYLELHKAITACQTTDELDGLSEDLKQSAPEMSEHQYQGIRNQYQQTKKRIQENAQ